MDDIAREWFLKALDLKEGEEMFIPCLSLRDARKMVTALNHCKMLYTKFDPNKALAFIIGVTVRFNKTWVKIKLDKILPDVVFVKGTDGVTQAHPISGLVGERERKIRLMIEDGLTRSEIENILGQLSESEIEKYFQG